MPSSDQSRCEGYLRTTASPEFLLIQVPAVWCSTWSFSFVISHSWSIVGSALIIKVLWEAKDIERWEHLPTRWYVASKSHKASKISRTRTAGLLWSMIKSWLVVLQTTASLVLNFEWTTAVWMRLCFMAEGDAATPPARAARCSW